MTRAIKSSGYGLASFVDQVTREAFAKESLAWLFTNQAAKMEILLAKGLLIMM